MNRVALEHIIRAAADITREREFVVIGSQAVLGQFPDAPDRLLVSIEADVYPRHAPEKSDLIDGAIGELSRFHETFGYYAHGVDDTTAVVPPGWTERLVSIESADTDGAIGWCLEVHDLAISKLVAGRERDMTYLSVLLGERMVDSAVLKARLYTMPLSSDELRVLTERLGRLLAAIR
ncbi:MAG: DUF6036 family nucleotidyltransferase [Acidobacteriota bacterium]